MGYQNERLNSDRLGMLKQAVDSVLNNALRLGDEHYDIKTSK